jgi:hypothetical protein
MQAAVARRGGAVRAVDERIAKKPLRGFRIIRERTPFAADFKAYGVAFYRIPAASSTEMC